MENTGLDLLLNKKVSEKMAELLSDGYVLSVSNTDKPAKYFRYYQFIKYYNNGLIDDIVVIGILKPSKHLDYHYVMQIIDGLDNNIVEEKVFNW